MENAFHFLTILCNRDLSYQPMDYNEQKKRLEKIFIHSNG